MFIKCVIVDLCLEDERLYQNATTNIHTDNIGNHLITHITGKPNHAPGSCMHVGHDTYLASVEGIHG